MTKNQMIKELQRAEAKAWKEYCEFKAEYVPMSPEGVQARRMSWMTVDTLLSDMKIPRFTPGELFAEGLVPNVIK